MFTKVKMIMDAERGTNEMYLIVKKLDTWFGIGGIG